jgi:hypothetical protein
VSRQADIEVEFQQGDQQLDVQALDKSLAELLLSLPDLPEAEPAPEPRLKLMSVFEVRVLKPMSVLEFTERIHLLASERFSSVAS